MNTVEIDKLRSIVGDEDKVFKLCSELGNKRLPGKRYCFRILREKFLHEFHGRDIPGFAEKYGVSISSLYNWIR